MAAAAPDALPPAGEEPGARLRLGQLVTSRAGRDAGHRYLVVGFRPDGRVLVADGKRRRLAQAKAKNPRHLWGHDRVAGPIAQALGSGGTVADAQIGRALDEMLE